MIGQATLVWAGCLSAAVSGFLGSHIAFKARGEQKLKKLVKQAVTSTDSFSNGILSCGIAQLVMESILRESALSKGNLLPSPVRALASAGMGRFESRIRLAGVFSRVTTEGMCRTRISACVLSAAVFGLLGYLGSSQLAIIGALIGLILGWMSIPWALGQEGIARKRSLERHLSEAIEVICLGLRSGLSFDYALKLYCDCFDSVLSRELSIAQQEWQAGLRSREEVLRKVASTYDSAVFSRVVDNIIRAMRFGSPLADSLELLAEEARQSHKAYVEEKVMKAPVKMMLPVGTLILPSMLILVLGPILLDLMQGF